MGQMLEDGSIVPHYLSAAPSMGVEDDGGMYGNDLFRVGEVRDVVYADDKRNPYGRCTVYSVEVQHYDRHRRTYVGRIYPRCVVANLFGSAADRLNISLRTAASGGGTTSSGLGKGAKVLIMCINGEQHNAVIVGAVPDPSDDSQTSTKRKDLGHNLDFLFNGLSAVVNDDGELTLKYNGKTKADGSTDSSVQSSNAGGVFSMTKDGHFSLTPPQGLKIGQATDYTILGQSFRTAHQQMHSTLQSTCTSIQESIVAAATALNTAGASMSVPIAGAVAAAPQIAAAGAALQAAAQLVGQLATALQTFEQAAGQKNSFLSKLHKSD